MKDQCKMLKKLIKIYFITLNNMTYEQLINDAKASKHNRTDKLRLVIERVCWDNGMDKDSTWAILEAFDQK